MKNSIKVQQGKLAGELFWSVVETRARPTFSDVSFLFLSSRRTFENANKNVNEQKKKFACILRWEHAEADGHFRSFSPPFPLFRVSKVYIFLKTWSSLLYARENHKWGEMIFVRYTFVLTINKSFVRYIVFSLDGSISQKYSSYLSRIVEHLQTPERELSPFEQSWYSHCQLFYPPLVDSVVS